MAERDELINNEYNPWETIVDITDSDKTMEDISDSEQQEMAERDELINNEDKPWEMIEYVTDVVEDMPKAPLNIKSFKDINEEQCQTIAKAVASIVLFPYWCCNWSHPKIVFTKERLAFCSIREAVFKSMAKFVLNIFDMEDFQRVAEREMIIRNCQEFYGALRADYSVHFDLEPAVRAMKDISERKMDVKKFPFLQQQDIDYVLVWYHRNFDGGIDFFEANKPHILFPVDSEQRFGVHEHHVRAVLEVMAEYVPLQEDEKKKLIMDMEQGSYESTVRGLYRKAKEDFYLDEFDKLHNGYSFEVDCILYGIENSFLFLAEIKSNLLKSLKKSTTFTLVFGAFNGRFTKEVVEFVWKVNLMKRLEDRHRCLQVRHMMTGFSLSRIADIAEKIVKEGGHASHMCEDDLLETNVVYYIYKSSGDVARVLGSEKIELEHLFLATVFRRQQIDDENYWKMIVRKEDVVEFLKKSVVHGQHYSYIG